MLRATALLIVTLLSAPNAAVMCAIWCGTSDFAERHGAQDCHADHTRAADATKIVDAAACHLADGAPEFVVEARRDEAGAASSISSASGTGMLMTLAGDAPTLSWSVRRPHSPPDALRHFVLRI